MGLALDGLAELASAHLPSLLLAYWGLASGAVMATVLPLPVPRAFKDAVYLAACRGKLWQDKPAALGPLKDWAVPQAWFLHFYLLGAAANALVLAAYSCSLRAAASLTLAQAQPLLALGLFQLHLLRRAAETAWLLRYPRGAVMHGLAYAFGLSYYVVVPLSLLPAAWIRSQQWQHAGPLADAPQLLLQQLPRALSAASGLQLAGAALFLAANALQLWAHASLAALARGRQPASERGAYRIPRGPLFDLVSCPHYAAEIALYAGLLLACRGALLPALMLAWVGVNLALAASATHAWYRARFRTYPQQRRALVPWVW